MKFILCLILPLLNAVAAQEFLFIIEMTAEQMDAAGVETRRLRKQMVRNEIVVPATLVSSELGISEVFAHTDGIFVSNLKLGQMVSEHEVLGQLFPAVLEETHDVEKDLFEAEAELKRERQEILRLESLVKDKSASVRELMEAQTRYQITNNRVEALRKHLEWLLETGYKNPDESLPIATLTSGVIENLPSAARKWVHRGDLLVKVSNPRSLQAQIKIFPSLMEKIPNLQKLQMNGAEISDPRMVPGVPPLLVAEVTPGTQHLLAGNTVAVTAAFQQQHASLCLQPDEVIREGSDGLVFVDMGDGHFGMRKVTLGRDSGKCLELLSGAEAGEFIVSSGVWQMYLMARSSQGGDHHGHSH